MKQKILLCLFFISFSVQLIYAQKVPGLWNDYFSYSDVKQLFEVDNKIFSLTQNGIWIYNIHNGEITTYSKIQGLSCSNLTTMVYDEYSNSLYIGYKNGALDIMNCSNMSVSNISSILQKSIYGSKSINSIYCNNEFVYLSTDFGLVIYNSEKREFVSTTILGTTGNYIPVYDVVINNTLDSIYIATEVGLKSSNINLNLADLYMWNTIELGNHTQDKISDLAYLNNSLYYVYKDQDSSKYDSLFVLNNGVTNAFKTQIGYVTSLKSIGDSLYIAGYYNARIYDSSSMLRFVYDSSSVNNNRINDICVDSKGFVWIATSSKGILQSSTNNSFVPQGPLSNMVADVYFANNNLYYVAGRAGVYKIGQMSTLYPNGVWYSHVNWAVKNSVTVYPITNSNTYYYGTTGWGIVQCSSTWTYDTIYNKYNSSVQNVYENDNNYQDITDITSDNKGNVWFLNELVWKPILVKSKLGQWYSFSIPGMTNSKNSLRQICINSSGQKWIAGAQNVIVFNENNTLDDTADDEYVIISLRDSEGEIASASTCVVEDNDGKMWIGTTQGIAVHASPSRVFKGEETIRRIKIEIDNEVGYLLSSDYITDIIVDGANRKWIGTQNSGVFLISADGTEEIAHYDVTNSPLPSNYIVALTINHLTGEVFIATESGLVSIIGEATQASNELSEIFVSPNPVREDYSGDIYIRNTPTNAIFKVTTVSGKLVFEDKALGGTGVWNGKNLYGDRVQTGVYLIYISNEDGSLSTVRKILFIN